MATEEKTEGTQQVAKAKSAQAISPFEEMDRMFDNYFSHGWFRPFHMEWPSFSKSTMPFEGKTPKVDVIERKKEIVVKAELPGVDKKDLDISVTKNTVTIKGSTRHEEKEEKGDYYHCEMSRGSYSRSLTLPANVDEENSKAKFKNGILELTLPKLKKSKRHTIKVE